MYLLFHTSQRKQVPRRDGAYVYERSLRQGAGITSARLSAKAADLGITCWSDDII